MTIPPEKLEAIAKAITEFYGSPEWEKNAFGLQPKEARAWEQQQIAQIIAEGIATL